LLQTTSKGANEHEIVPAYFDFIRVSCFLYGGAAKLQINRTFTIARAGRKG